MLINLLQRYYLWIFIFLSGLTGLALGHLAATSVGLLATPAFTVTQKQKVLTQKNVTPLTLASYQDILSHNIFNSAATEQAFSHASTTPKAAQKSVQPSSKWTLIGTISGGAVPIASLNDGKETNVYRLNDELPDTGKLASIERNKVEIRYPDGRSVILENLPEETRPAQTNSARTKVTTAAPDGANLQVEDLGENRWQIPAEVAENARANIGNLLTQAQAVPYLENGKTTGFQIRMIQAGSLIAQLGLQKGDILREVNGVALNAPEKALQIFGQLRQAKQISIGLERRGKAMTFAYEVR